MNNIPLRGGGKGRRILESIDDERRKMLTSIGMLYALSYPAFTTKLSQLGLRSEEIGSKTLHIWLKELFHSCNS